MDKDAAFRKKLLATFAIEAREHLDAITSRLVALAAGPHAVSFAEAAEALCRETHSLKGAARAVDQRSVETVCRGLEEVFVAIKKHEMPPTPGLIDEVHRAVDGLNAILSQASSGAGETHRALAAATSEALRNAAEAARSEAGGVSAVAAGASPRVQQQSPAPPAIPQVQAPPAEARPAETVRIPTAKLDAILLGVEEMLPSALAAEQHAAGLSAVRNRVADWRRKCLALKADARTMDRAIQRAEAGAREPADAPLRRLVEFHGQSLEAAREIEASLAALLRANEHHRQALDSTVARLLDDSRKALMQPFQTVADFFPRFVRDLAREQGKETALVVDGAGIEVDRRVLEQIKDPLVHLVRNAVDHGIGTPAERSAHGKTASGTITITLGRAMGGMVELEVADDGAGIDPAAVRQAARRLDGVSAQAIDSLDDAQALSLVFESGVTTSPIITDISGRGLGLAIVREKVERLGGSVSVTSRLGQGTRFTIRLPVTLATFRGVLVSVGGELFIIPTSHVTRVGRVRPEQIATVENRETIAFGDGVLGLLRLADVLATGAKPPTAGGATLPFVAVTHGDTTIALLVDEIVAEQDVVVKDLGSHLKRAPNVAGAALMGSGAMVPVLSVPELIKDAGRERGVPARVETGPAETRSRSLLVVEDSITSRMLLKNILESAGFKVEVAVDGIDAFTKLRIGEFDAVVSDVEMPRMDGFDLTARIRADKKLSEMPVVLVTALESREDRERGIEVGANAYIVKSSFDQSNLLDVLQRLV